MDGAGTILFEGACPMDPDEIVRTINAEANDVEKIVHESGPLRDRRLPSVFAVALTNKNARIVCSILFCDREN